MASKSHKGRLRRRGPSRKSPVLDLRSRLDRNNAHGGELGGHMHNLQMTVHNWEEEEEGDFGRRFKHVPELEEEEVAPLQRQQRSNSVSDLREKLHTSHGNPSMTKDGSRRIRKHRRGGIEIQVETSIEDYRRPRSPRVEEYGEYRQRREDLQPPIDYQYYRQENLDRDLGWGWGTDNNDGNYNYNNQQHYQPFSPERHQRRHGYDADSQYTDGYLRNHPRDEEYSIQRDSDYQLSTRLDRGNSYYDNKDDFCRDTNLDHYDERLFFNNPDSTFLDQRNYSSNASRSRYQAVTFADEEQVEYDNVELPHESVSDLIPKIDILPVANRQKQSVEKVLEGLPLPAPSRKESLPPAKETQSDPSTSSSRRRPRSLTKQTTSKDPIALIGEDPFAASEAVKDGSEKRAFPAKKSTSSSFKDFMNNKNSRSLAEIRNYHLDEVKKSRSSNLVSKDLSKKANRSLSPKVHTSNRRSVERNSSRDFGPKRAKSQERRGRDGAPQRSRRCPKSPRIKSRSPRRRPRQHRSPKDTRGRIKSSKGRSRGRSMSPRPSRRLTRKSPVMSPMRDDHRPPPPPPPRDLFASSATDEKVVVKEEIVDLACSDDEEVNCQRCRDDSHSPYCLNCKNVGHSTNECTRNREVCAYCRKTGHNIVSCPTVECKRCDQRGHIAMVCNSEERIQKPRFEQGQVLTCYNCDLNGHVMRNCPFKKTNESLKKKQASNNDQSAHPVISIDYHHLETKSAAPIAKPMSTMYTFIQEAKNNTEVAKAMMFTWNLAGHDQDTLFELMQKKSPPTRIQLRKILIDELSFAPAGDIPMSVPISELLDLTQDYLMPQDRVNLMDGKISSFSANSKSSFASSSKLPSEKKASLDTSEAMNKLHKLLAMIDLQVGPPNSEDRQRFDLRLDELEPLRGFIVERMSRKASQFAVAEEYVHKAALAIVKVLSVCNFELKLMERHLQNYGEESFAELLVKKMRIYEPHLPTGITSAYVSNFIVDFFD